MPLFGGVGGEPERVAQLSPRRRRLYLDQKFPFGGGNLERGQFGVALNELVDGLQISADVRIKPVFIWAVRNRA